MRHKSKELLVLLTILFTYLVYRHLFTHKEESKTDIPKWKLSPLWAEDQKPQINPHRFGILINNQNLCKENQKVDLLVLVASAVEHEERRLAIRQTWGSNPGIKLAFLLGQGRDSQSKIHSENEAFHDIIQEDFEVKSLQFLISFYLSLCQIFR